MLRLRRVSTRMARFRSRASGRAYARSWCRWTQAAEKYKPQSRVGKPDPHNHSKNRSTCQPIYNGDPHFTPEPLPRVYKTDIPRGQTPDDYSGGLRTRISSQGHDHREEKGQGNYFLQGRFEITDHKGRDNIA